MTGPLYTIGRFCSRHHYPVIALWLVLAIALVAISSASGSKTSENLTLPGTGSTKATELLEDNLPEQAYGSNPLVSAGIENVRGLGIDYGFPVDLVDIDKIVLDNADFWPSSEGYHDGPIGFLARELLSEIPGAMARPLASR